MIPDYRTACLVLVAWSGVLVGAGTITIRSVLAVRRAHRR